MAPLPLLLQCHGIGEQRGIAVNLNSNEGAATSAGAAGWPKVLAIQLDGSVS
jgi:hypothetical protein